MTVRGAAITSRDRKLLRVMFDYGILTSRQMSLWFFTGVRKTTVMRRLRRLEKGKYIRKRGTQPDGTAVYLIGETGAKYLGEGLQHTTYPFHQIEHEIQVADLRWRLESLGVVKSWMTERTLRSEIMKRNPSRERSKIVVPDALILFRDFLIPSGKVKLEMELHMKSNGRYQQRFRYFDQSAIFTWYVVKTNSCGDKILRLVDQYARTGAKSCIGYSSLEELESFGMEAKLHRLGSSAALKDILLLKDHPAHGVAQGMSIPKTSFKEKVAA